MSDSTFQALDGRTLAYDDEGSNDAAPPVLCLAGLTRDARDFTDIAAHLSARYRVLRLDSRGRGRSEWAEDPMAEYQVAVEAGDALALLDHLGIDRATIIGTSRGGILAMGIAAAANHRLAGVVLNDIGPVIEQEGLDVIAGYIGVAPKATTWEEAAAALARNLASQYADLTDEDWLAMAHSLYTEKDGKPGLSYDPRLSEPVLAMIEAGGGPPLWPYFDAFEGVPLLTIRGGLSNLFSAATLEEMQKRRPDMASVTLPNRGHVPLLKEPPAVAAIDTFLAEAVS